MNKNQFINSICRRDYGTMTEIERLVRTELAIKHSPLTYAKDRNLLQVIITDYSYEDGFLYLEFQKELFDGRSETLYVAKIKVPDSIAVELPKVILALFQDIQTIDIMTSYKKFFFFTKNLIINFKVTQEVMNRIEQETLNYNVGFSGNIEKQEVDIESFGKRDGKKIDTLYMEFLKLLSSKDIDYNGVTLSKLNTIQYVGKTETFHLTYSALLAKDPHDYKVIYDKEDNNFSKDTALKYLFENYEDNDLEIVQSMLELL